MDYQRLRYELDLDSLLDNNQKLNYPLQNNNVISKSTVNSSTKLKSLVDSCDVKGSKSIKVHKESNKQQVIKHYDQIKKNMDDVPLRHVTAKKIPQLNKSKRIATAPSLSKEKQINESTSYPTKAQVVIRPKTNPIHKFESKILSSTISGEITHFPENSPVKERTTQDILKSLKMIQKNELNRTAHGSLLSTTIESSDELKLTQKLTKYAQRIDEKMKLADNHFNSYKILKEEFMY